MRYEFAGFLFDVASRQLFRRDGELLSLSPRAMDALLLFLERPGVLRDKRALTAALWPDTSVGDNSLDQIMSQLRRVLRDTATGEPCIATEKGRGYRLTSRVQRLVDRGSSLHSEPRQAAQRLYQEAHTLIRRASPANFDGALGLLNAALEHDPSFALALAERAMLRTLFVTFDLPMSAALEKAEEEAGLALQIDPRLGRAHQALAYVLVARGRWRQARGRFDVACELEPEPDARIARVILLAVSVGHLRLALDWALEAMQVVPEAALSPVAMATVCDCMGMEDEATRHAERAAELGWPRLSPPLLDMRFRRACRHRDYGDAAECIRLGLAPRVLVGAAASIPERIGSALDLPAERQRAAAALRMLVTERGAEGLGPLNLRRAITWFALLGSMEDAYGCFAGFLDHLAPRGSIGGPWDILWLPEMDGFRRHRRFQSVIDRLGLGEYWRYFGPPDGA